MCQLTGHTASVQANVFQCALSPRQSDSQISAPLSFKTSCNPVLVIFSLLCSAFNHIYIIIYLIVFVLYCLLLVSLTFLVIQPLGCERDIKKLLLLLWWWWSGGCKNSYALVESGKPRTHTQGTLGIIKISEISAVLDCHFSKVWGCLRVLDQCLIYAAFLRHWQKYSILMQNQIIVESYWCNKGYLI